MDTASIEIPTLTAVSPENVQFSLSGSIASIWDDASYGIGVELAARVDSVRSCPSLRGDDRHPDESLNGPVGGHEGHAAAPGLSDDQPVEEIGMGPVQIARRLDVGALDIDIDEAVGANGVQRQAGGGLQT